MMGSYKRRIVSWAGLFLLAFNVAGGTALPIMPMRSGTQVPVVGSLAADDSICTHGGMVSRTVPRGHNQQQAPALCAFCMPLLHGTLDTVSDAVLQARSVDFYQRVTLSAMAQGTPESTLLSAHNGARAPPISQV